MCGLAGFWQLHGGAHGALLQQVQAMSVQLTHRGPDDSGVWCDEAAGIALAQRRLSILDLSPAGHQPMHSACGRYVVVFNGEIYNHLDLRERLLAEGAAPAWRGHSDTETLLACFVAWGVERALQASVGMFAFALWDRQQRALTLARDRMGEKPLYYGWQDDTLLFGSELKALKAHAAFHADIDRDALALLLRHDCIPAPHAIYHGVFKLRPGHLLRISADAPRDVQPVPYWRYNDAVSAGLRNPLHVTDAEATDALEAQLSASVEAQMLADVPLGAFLSGGIDSSTIVALMQARSARPIKTFTMGFGENGYDEAVHAKSVAAHLGTEHTELYVRPEDALAVIPRLPTIFCEPFGDSSQIPTFLISQLTRRQVTVALSGDGGDELFGGYNRYLGARTAWERMQRLPWFARQAGAGALRAMSPAAWNRWFERVKPLLPKRWRLATPGDKAQKLADVLTLSSGHAFFLNLASQWKDPGSVVIGAHEPVTLLTDPAAWPHTDNLAHWMMAMDAQSYLPDDILVKVDRAAMANSLETRVPMLDHRVVELAWRIPLHQKIRGGEGKWLLRQVLYRHVPRELIERPKMGFGIPLDSWLRGPLRDWAEALLDEDRLHREGYFHPAPIRQKWKEHLSGRHNWQHRLWTVLMFQAWLEESQRVSS
ncbi:asparagine synthase (glutamine-hydrolyzing) [Rhodanobacter terrae]|uniref:asparagine synthase (glutamine-hydrolyzing) n=1 Tax=Rhodanobacter terrae TaxID=418647 RepID=A0ABW0SSM3_9GAMM